MRIRRRVLAAPDKLRGTATAVDAAAAIAGAAIDAGWDCSQVPVSDGGEGLLDCFGGGNRRTKVRGPLDDTVYSAWRLDGNRAIVEMATASGLALVAGRNDPIAATSHGTGQLIAAAIHAGADHIVVGAGGSASTDGGLGALEVLSECAPLDGSRGYRVIVATDVTTSFLDAASVFGPQKGADSDQVNVLSQRLRDLAAVYRNRFGVDVIGLRGAGAAGGLGGGLAALRATIRPGFEFVAEERELHSHIRAADLVITGEGRLDLTSRLGKAPYGVMRMCARQNVAVAVIAGEIAADVELSIPAISLTARYGRDASLHHTVECIRAAVSELLAELPI